ncbi:hypothetical protein [Gloeobacter kilaueensis]|uniref:Uncharacterized protein n=1 Tax=Gloeobacter kilaueensis (strain ATCC BAA-2537 / CCAP 1431/1 / ULC 316 / JS1) TaxID=1183438 RepID=U5QG94_GLOK1|nr:hypothetical protein [Gloeobacter kilaueensis]AGY57987.1 hypothetical protein GKIL_1741 [Gloeobacter kilaueensis JS1]
MQTSTSQPSPISALLDAWAIVLSYRQHLNILAGAVSPDFVISVGSGNRCSLVWQTFTYDLPPFSAERIPVAFREAWCLGHYDGSMFLPQDPPSEPPAHREAYLLGHAAGEAQSCGLPVFPPDLTSLVPGSLPNPIS